MTEPEDIRHHIRQTHADFLHKSWCGVDVWSTDWTFQSIDHAAYAVMQEMRMQPCPSCLEEARAALSGERKMGNLVLTKPAYTAQLKWDPEKT